VPRLGSEKVQERENAHESGAARGGSRRPEEVGTVQTIEDTNDLRDRAIARLKKKSDLRAHLFAYVLVNAMLVGIWAVTGAEFFWPIFPILGWGIGVAFNIWDVYRVEAPTEDDIRHEMEALGRRR
jgi:hypothetical protein